MQFRTCSKKKDHSIQASFFVSPQGDDSWEGTLDRPFQTIGRAQESVRALNGHMTGDIVVYLRAGEYFLKETLLFSEADSGTNGYQVIYKNADGLGSARLIGGTRVSDWVTYSGDIFQTSVRSDVPITTLYEDGVRADEARFPDRRNPLSLPTSRSPYLTSANATPSGVALTYGSGDLPPLSGNLSGLKAFIWSSHDWFTDIVPIIDYNPATHARSRDAISNRHGITLFPSRCALPSGNPWRIFSRF